MKRLLAFTVAALMGLTASGRAGCFKCLNCGIHCVEPRDEPCLGCKEKCHKHCSAHKSEHAGKLIEKLEHGDCCCERIKAAEKLGCCLHANYCCCPEVLTALVHALQDDSCWEVRKAAAWSIAHQKARTPYAVLALYLSGRLDPHYLVRDAATDALAVLMPCRMTCPQYKDLVAAADELIPPLRARKVYRPGTSTFSVNFESLCAGNGITVTEPVEGPLGTVAPAPPAGTTPEPIPAPKGETKY